MPSPLSLFNLPFLLSLTKLSLFMPSPPFFLSFASSYSFLSPCHHIATLRFANSTAPIALWAQSRRSFLKASSIGVWSILLFQHRSHKETYSSSLLFLSLSLSLFLSPSLINSVLYMKWPILWKFILVCLCSAHTGLYGRRVTRKRSGVEWGCANFTRGMRELVSGVGSPSCKCYGGQWGCSRTTC